MALRVVALVCCAMVTLVQGHTEWQVVDKSPPLPLRQGHSMVAWSQYLFVFGGYSSTSGSEQFYGDVWRYDTVGKSWLKVSVSAIGTPASRAYHSAVVHADSHSMIIYGGVSRSAVDSPLTNWDDLWAFDMSSNTWRQLSPGGRSPGARNEHVAEMVGNSMFVFGGVNSHNSATADLILYNDLWQYRVDVNQWQQVDTSAPASLALPASRFAHTSAVVSVPHDAAPGSSGATLGFAVFGGRGTHTVAGSQSLVMLRDVWSFDFAQPQNFTGWRSGRWRQIQMTGVAVSRAYQTMVSWNGSLYAFAGFTRTDATMQAVAFVYNDLLRLESPMQSSDAWDLGLFNDAPPTVRFDHRAALMNSTMYMFGGRFEQLQTGLFAVDLAQLDAQQWRQAVDADFLDSNGGDPLLTSVHFMIAVLGVMALCFCVLVITIRRTFRAHAYPGQASVEPTHAQHTVVQMTPIRAPESVIAALPVVEYVPPAADSSEARLPQTDCSICLAEFEAGDQLKELPCMHRYHEHCIARWLTLNRICPLCKADVVAGYQQHQRELHPPPVFSLS